MRAPDATLAQPGDDSLCLHDELWKEPTGTAVVESSWSTADARLTTCSPRELGGEQSEVQPGEHADDQRDDAEQEERRQEAQAER